MIDHITTDELTRINEICHSCKHWQMIKVYGYEYPYCNLIKSDSAIFRINRCNGEHKE